MFYYRYQSNIYWHVFKNEAGPSRNAAADETEVAKPDDKDTPIESPLAQVSGDKQVYKNFYNEWNSKAVVY